VLARIESDAAERGKRIALYVLTCLVFGAAAFAVRSEYVFLGTLSAAEQKAPRFPYARAVAIHFPSSCKRRKCAG